MKTRRLLAATAAAIPALTGSAALARDRGNQQGPTQFGQTHPPAGLGNRDRLLPPAGNHRVAIGGDIAPIDRTFQVNAVVHFHDNH
jgi:hypothetical protein